MVRDFGAPAVWAGLTAFIWYAFGTVPLQMAVSAQLGLSAGQSSSWMFIVWFTGAATSIGLSLWYRLPIPITWSIPGLVYLGSLAGEYSFAEMVGANLVAGVLIVVLGLAGVGARLMAWLPLPIVMGMFGGSILEYLTRLVTATIGDALVAGAAVAGFLLGRALRNPRIPPLGLAVIAGVAAASLGGRWVSAEIAWVWPSVAVTAMEFSPAAIVAISLPMLVLAMALGNVQGLGFLMAQGYTVPVNATSVAVGLTSIVNAVFGGHPAIVARTGVAILAAPDAGPPEGRYWASVVAAVLTLLLAFAAMPVMSLIGIVPASLVYTLAGLAVVSAMQDALEKAFGATLRFAALTAFVVAATPFSILGIASAFWAVVAGMIVAVTVERTELMAFLRPPQQAGSGKATGKPAT